MNNKRQFRQGDVLLIEVSDAEFNTENLEATKNKTVALGEATGHHHTFDGDVMLYEDKGTELAINDRGILIDVINDSVLTHQEHAPIEVPKGKYKRIIQREYTPEGIVNVAD